MHDDAALNDSRLASPGGTAEIALAEPDLCACACREIYAQRDRWRERRFFGTPPYYTLGMAAYADLGFAGESLEAYLADAGTVRSLAGTALAKIADRLRDALANHLAEPVEYASDLPSPGFHIFIGLAISRADCSRRAADCASTHFDLQYRHIPWKRFYTCADLDSTISFTLPLKLPAAGGGLMVWHGLTLDRMRKDLASGRWTDIASAAHATPAARIPYTVGRAVVHSGHVLHQAAGVTKVSVTDERITLQGHGVFADGAWRLYW